MSGPIVRSAPDSVPRMLLGVDVGGTFTDAVLAAPGRIVTAKAPTTPEDQSLGVMDGDRRRTRGGGRAARRGARRSRTA